MTASVATLAACAGAAETVHTGRPHDGVGASSSGTPSVSSASPTTTPDRTRRSLGAPQEEALPVELAPMAGGASVLAIAPDGERGAWARTIDGTGALGKMRWFEAQHVVTAFEGKDGRTTFVTSDGEQVCVATYGREADAKADPEARGCAVARPEVVVPIGDRVALLSLDVTETLVRATTKPKAAAPKSTGATAKKADKPKAATSKKAAKKTSKPKPKKKKKQAEPVMVPDAKAKVDVRVAWVGRDGAFDLAGAPAGLGFVRPLWGMMLADVAPRGGGADLLFYESVAKPTKKSKTSWGSARLGVASLDATGKLANGTRATLADGDLEYGYITGQNAPRLITNGASTGLVSFAGRGGACRAERVLPSLGPAVLSKATCLVDPIGASSAITQAAAERLLSASPRRAPGQTGADAPLVVWAGDRAVFVGAAGFGAASRSDGAPNPAAAPFVAKRARVAWSAFAPDGEGVAFAAGKVFRMDTAGAVTEVVDGAAFDALGPRAAEAVRRVEDVDLHRPAARIGDAFWIARRDVVRLSASPMKVDALAGRAIPESSALVGGRERGMFVEVASGVLRVTFVAKDGSITSGPSITSPVRAGFSATERAAGGALVAGVSAADPTKVVAFAIDAEGKAIATRPTSLGVFAGTFGVRLTALPDGGALLTDVARRHVVWLDDDANERAAAALPADRVMTACLDGRPAPRSIPSPEPGKLIAATELATAGTCVVGDVAWTTNGGLRWFGTSVRGIDSLAETGAIDGLVPPRPQGSTVAPNPTAAAAASQTERTGTTPPSTATTLTPPSPSASSAAPVAPSIPCGADMVSISGRFCVDRFESTLVDAKTERVLSPDYPPTPNLLESVLGDWATERAHWGNVHARAFPLPALAAWQRGAKTEPTAIARFGARPNGYVTGLVAESACAAAGKRLCTLDEFTTACRGEADTDFPYGADYQDGVCNVFRDDHPAAILHHNASLGHLDPRLNRVRSRGRPLFETTGTRPACRSVWGSDAVYDLVGNLDEWIDEGTGAFAGGFYSRSTRAGCDAVITAHPKVYADYSTGVRCCKDAEK